MNGAELRTLPRPPAGRFHAPTDWNDTQTRFPQLCLHEMFECQVERTPDAVALVLDGHVRQKESGRIPDSDSPLRTANCELRIVSGSPLTTGSLPIHLSCRELNGRANRLAWHLLGLGSGPEAPVGICMGRSAESVAGLLAVFKAGAAYLPLDPSYPAQRLSFMLLQAGAGLLLGRNGSADSLGNPNTVDLTRTWDAIARQDDCNPALPIDPQRLAYVIYTSGSTGSPKGVAVSHGAIANQIQAKQKNHPLDSRDCILFKTLSSFDPSFWEIFAPLTRGARLVIAKPEGHRDVPYLLGQIRRHGVTVLQAVPTQLKALAQGEGLRGCSSLRLILCGAEALTAPLRDEVLSQLGVPFFNLYGPTEAAIDTTFWDCRNEIPDRTAPIGKPIANTQVRILDRRHWQPVPLGEEGELCIGGKGLARGYLGQPALTAQKFIPDALSGAAGRRLYRSGDLARCLPDGNIEFLGRIDQQIKLWGLRIEPGEIESHLEAHPGVCSALVMLRDGAGYQKRLVAYATGASSRPRPKSQELRRFLAERLPAHMVPSQILLLDELPLTPSGKLDRRRLPAPAPAKGPPADFRSPYEEMLAGIWCEVLQLERVNRQDSLLELGGHSLAAVQTAARIRQALGVEIPLNTIFEAPSLAELARGLEKRGQSAPAAMPPVQRISRDSRLPLTTAQERVWFVERLTPGQAAYNAQMNLRLEGPLRPAVLQSALQEMLRRHEILRTSFPAVQGRPCQRIHPPWKVEVPLADLSGLGIAHRQAERERLIRRLSRTPFDISRPPLLRWTLLRTSGRRHVFIHSEHHLIHDGWSQNRILTELQILYTAFAEKKSSLLPELPLQFADVAAWERRWVESADVQARLVACKERLRGAPPLLELPTDRPRPRIPSRQGCCLIADLPAGLYDGLKSLSRRRGATLFMTMLAAFQTLLHRYSGQTDFLLGSAMANRRLRESEDQLGMLVNNVVLRAVLQGGTAFGDLLEQVRRSTLEAYADQDLPFDKLVQSLQPERDLSRNPLIQALFSFHDSPLPRLRFAGLTGELEYRMNGTSKFDLNVIAVPHAEQRLGSGDKPSRRITMFWEANADLFHPSRLQRMAGHFQALLEGILEDPQRRLGELPLLPAAQRHQLLREWNATGQADGRGTCAHHLFEMQARRHPHSAALAEGSLLVSYGELDRRANRLAGRLKRLGAAPEVPAALCLEAGAAMVTGLLGVLKAGSAYLPMDASLPPRRLGFMLEDSRSALLLAKSPPTGLRGLPVLDPDQASAPHPQDAPNPHTHIRPSNLAYLIYTSGSTGRPKGVAVEHRGLVNLLRWHLRSYGMQPGQHASQVAGTGFDASVWEVWSAMSAGAVLHLADSQRRTSPAKLAAWLRAAQIGICFLPTPLAEAALQEDWPGGSALKALLTGGDRLHGSALRSLPAPLFNHYGPTENSVVATCCRVAGAGADPPIGRPIDNVQVQLLDSGLNPVPIGVAGELCIGGKSLARGYWHRPGLTAERFIPDPFSGSAGGRLYRTGDLVRHRPDGAIDFLGRLDHQVKLRGFRIEAGEVEAVLCRHPQVGEAAVMVQGEGEQKALAAYLVQKESGRGERGRGDSGTGRGTGSGRGQKGGHVQGQGRERNPDSGSILPPASRLLPPLSSFLRERLPDYMVPANFILLDRLPLTANGKLDRAALPVPGQEPQAGLPTYPRTPLEELVAEFWRLVLKLPRVDAHANFFELGGHSLLGARMLARIGEALSLELPLQTLFQCPTVAQLARRIEEGRQKASGGSVEPILPRTERGRLPLSFAQQRLWFMHQVDPQSAAYNFRTAVRLRGGLDLAALRSALAEIVQRHEALRTAFDGSSGGQPLQQVLPPAPPQFVVADLSGLSQRPSSESLQKRVEEFARRPFRLEKAPLLRALLLRLGEGDQALAVAIHHIAWDGRSAEVFCRDLAAFYEAFAEKRLSPLPPLPVQYADYALWQRRQLQGRRLHKLTQFWVRRLAGAPPQIDLPFDRPRPALQRFGGQVRTVLLPQGLGERVRALGLEQGASPFMAFLAAFKALLHFESGQTDILVGADVSNRSRSEVEGLIGLFVNQLVLRTSLAGNPRFGQLVQRVKETVLEAFAHQDLPFEKLVEALQPRRDLSRNPIFQVMFVFQNNPSALLELPGLDSTPIPLSARSSAFDLSLFVQAGEDPVAVSARYDTALFDASTIDGMLQSYLQLLEAAAALPEARLQELKPPPTSKEHDMPAQSKKPFSPGKLDRLMKARPKAVAVSPQNLVRSRRLIEGRDLPLLVEPAVESVDAAGWAASQRDFIEDKLNRHGGLLLRGFRIDSVERFEAFSRSAFGELIEYGERSSPRSQISGRIYTSTDHPADQPIVLHNEQSYTLNWPMKICFCCTRPALKGGATPIASNRAITRRIRPSLAQRFERKQVMYLRNYGEGLGLSWQTAFQTEDPKQVEAYCRRAKIAWEWRKAGRLRTRQVRPAFRRHPRTGEKLWFNHLVFFHVSSLQPSTRDSLLSSFAQEELPFNTFYGDGSALEAEVLDELRTVYRCETVSFPWQKGDVLLLDNMLSCHGREPFEGERQIATVMAEPWAELEAVQGSS